MLVLTHLHACHLVTAVHALMHDLTLQQVSDASADTVSSQINSLPHVPHAA